MRHPSNMASRASRSRGSTVNPYFTFTASTRPANQHWLCFGCLSAASLATFSWRFKLPVASVRLSRSRTKRRLGNRRRDRGAECCLASNPPERLHHAQPPAASLKLNHAIGVGPGLGQSFRRRRPPHCAQRRVPSSRSYQRLAGTLHLASRCEATDPVHHSPAGITGAAGRVALLAAFTTARCARLRSRSALRRCSRLRSGCASRSRRFLSR